MSWAWCWYLHERGWIITFASSPLVSSKCALHKPWLSLQQVLNENRKQELQKSNSHTLKTTHIHLKSLAQTGLHIILTVKWIWPWGPGYHCVLAQRMRKRREMARPIHTEALPIQQHGSKNNMGSGGIKETAKSPKRPAASRAWLSVGGKKCLFRKNIIIRSHLASNNFCLKLSVMHHTSVWSWWKYTQRDKYVTETNLEWFSRFLAAHRWHFNLAQLKNRVRIYEISWVQF